MSNKSILAGLTIIAVLLPTVGIGQVAPDSVFSAQLKPKLAKTELANKNEVAQAALNNGAKNLTQPKKPVFSITGSYLETLRSKGTISVDPVVEPSIVDKVLKTPLNDVNMEMFVEDLQKKTLVLQVMPKAKPQMPQLQQQQIVFQKAPYGQLALAWPIYRGSISSHFGMRDGRPHEGSDITAPIGSPILAAADGQVISAGYNGAYGLLVEVLHPNGMKTRYAHCSVANVKPGQTVKRGQVIAAVGMTGRTTGPHVHFEVLINNHPVNPVQYLRV